MAAADTVLADELGVSPELVEGLRRNQLTEGEHWTRADGNRVAYTEAGCAALRLALDLEKKKDAPAKKEGPGEDCLCEVVRVHPSPIAVRVRVPDGSLQDVRVRNNSTLHPRHRLRCRQLTDGRWECCQPGLGVALPPLKKKEVAP